MRYLTCGILVVHFIICGPLNTNGHETNNTSEKQTTIATLSSVKNNLPTKLASINMWSSCLNEEAIRKIKLI